MIIRAERPADIAAIHKVVEEAFLRRLEAVLVDHCERAAISRFRWSRQRVAGSSDTSRFPT